MFCGSGALVDTLPRHFGGDESFIDVTGGEGEWAGDDGFRGNAAGDRHLDFTGSWVKDRLEKL